MVVAIVKRRKEVKRQKGFRRYQSKNFKRIARPTWRRPRGIDSRVRRQERGSPALVKAGYKTCKATRFTTPSGFKKFRVFNVKDLDLILMQNRVYAAEIAACVNGRNRVAIENRARALDIRVLNKKSRVRSQDAQ